MIKRVISYTRSRLRKWALEEIWLEDYLKRGMKMGKNCSIQPGVTFDYSHCWLINIGNNVTIAPQAYILAHDASSKILTGYTKLGVVTIEDDVFIGAKALIMPGVTIGKGSIIAAGSVVTKSVPEGCVYAGNPAREIKKLKAYIEKVGELLENSPKYDESYTINGKITNDQKEVMYRDLLVTKGFVR